MDAHLTGTVFDIKRYAIHDGPGIRSTVFFKGCPLHCIWCANPESHSFLPELTYDPAECLACGTCVQACPEKAVSMVGQEPVVDEEKCTRCGRCAESCPAEALRIMGRTVDIEGLYREMASDRPFWDRSGGGITLSGGEPLAQFDFALAFLKICKDRHVSTAIETCLYTAREKMAAVLDVADHVICDLKIMDNDHHRACTGVSNDLVKDNLRILLGTHDSVLVRMPLIPGINDSTDHLAAIGVFLETCRRGVRVELLPFHRLGESKYRRMKKSYRMAHVSPPSKPDMERARSVLREFDIHVLT